jgi:hypothetical protein
VSTLNFSNKDPDDDLPYELDWIDAMEDQTTIVDSIWEIPEGLTSHDPSINGKRTQIWLSGGTQNAIYMITNQITTNDGWKLSQSVRLRMSQTQ